MSALGSPARAQMDGFLGRLQAIYLEQLGRDLGPGFSATVKRRERSCIHDRYESFDPIAMRERAWVFRPERAVDSGHEVCVSVLEGEHAEEVFGTLLALATKQGRTVFIKAPLLSLRDANRIYVITYGCSLSGTSTEARFLDELRREAEGSGEGESVVFRCGGDVEVSPGYFASPERAVPIIADLVRNEAWGILARYYDLAGTGVSHAELESGRFFLRDQRPETAHPGLDWRIKHPFTPGFTFDRAEAGPGPDIVQVHVKIEIDQGGGMVQRGFSKFEMRKSARGFRILPPA